MTRELLLFLAGMLVGGGLALFFHRRTREDNEEDHWDGDHPPANKED